MTLIHRRNRQSIFVAALVATSLLAGSAAAQTKITAPKNKYTPQQDVQVGREAAAEVRKQMPMLNDDRTEEYIEDIGERLIANVPAEFRQPAFKYSFDVVNLRDINAFALPGGPMFVNRGMIQAAGSEAEVAGVMAHEISHVVLRHGTAQASAGQKFAIGAIAGQILGAIVGGRTGSVIAQGSEIGIGTYFLKYGREYERQADLLGAQIMARAGYDPRAMARMFQTIERQGGSRGPEWMSSHPNPGNRVEAINREAQSLRVASAPASHGDFQTVHARLERMPSAPTTAEIAKNQGQQRRTQGPSGTTARNGRVDPPSGDWRTYQPSNFMKLSVPSNWDQFGGNSGVVTYAPDGGYDEGSFTHGIQIGVAQSTGGDLQSQTDRLLQGFAQSNPNLRRQGGYSRTTIDGRQGLTATMSNVAADGNQEAVNVSTVQLRDGSVLFFLGVAPASESRTYMNAFTQVRRSVQLNDR